MLLAVSESAFAHSGKRCVARHVSEFGNDREAGNQNCETAYLVGHEYLSVVVVGQGFQVLSVDRQPLTVVLTLGSLKHWMTLAVSGFLAIGIAV